MSVSLYGSGNTVIQVVSATSNTQFSTSSTSLQNTGFSATITPQSTTSKILIIANLQISYPGTGGAGFAIYRGGSSIWQPGPTNSTGLLTSYLSGSGGKNIYPLTYLDSPSTTSATTYNIYISSYNGSQAGIINENGGTATGQSSITLIEISGS